MVSLNSCYEIDKKETRRRCRRGGVSVLGRCICTLLLHVFNVFGTCIMCSSRSTCVITYLSLRVIFSFFLPLRRMEFSEGVVGKALKGPICTFEFSGGVNVDHSRTIGIVASTVAHEMGHNLGMEHDTPECSCPSEKCIMSPSSRYE